MEKNTPNNPTKTNKNPQTPNSTPLRKKPPSRLSIYSFLTRYSKVTFRILFFLKGKKKKNSRNHLQLHVKKMHLNFKPWEGRACLSPVHIPGSGALKLVCPWRQRHTTGILPARSEAQGSRPTSANHAALFTTFNQDISTVKRCQKLTL